MHRNDFFFFCFLGLHPRHMEVPRLGVKLELQLLAYTTATATQDLSHVCDLYHSSQHCWIVNPLRPGIKCETSWLIVRFVSTAPQWEFQEWLLTLSDSWGVCSLVIPSFSGEEEISPGFLQTLLFVTRGFSALPPPQRNESQGAVRISFLDVSGPQVGEIYSWGFSLKQDPHLQALQAPGDPLLQPQEASHC